MLCNYTNIYKGAGLGVPSVRLNSERIAQRYQGNLIRINPTDTDLSTNQFQYSASSAITAGGVSLPTSGLKALKILDDIMEKK